MALRRLQKEYRDIIDNPNHEFYAQPMEVSNISFLERAIRVPFYNQRSSRLRIWGRALPWRDCVPRELSLQASFNYVSFRKRMIWGEEKNLFDIYKLSSRVLAARLDW